ncbi:MAG: hypothetical protein LBS62_06370 [Clostridiales bacterium]|jgi:hypothetical protein|nr:hypothetical protein [Clostridiales bacterium]
MDVPSLILVIFLIAAGVFGGLYFLNRWAYRKMGEQEEAIKRTKQSATIFVIDKKKTKMAEANMPKAVTEKMPVTYKFIKMPFVKAKVGPQIHTFICDKRVFEVIPVKKNVTVEIAGLYIVSMKGMKSEAEMKKLAKQKKEAKRQKNPTPLDKLKGLINRG